MTAACPDWINNSMFEEALRDHLKDPELELNTFTVRAALAAGDNFTSDMYRAVVDYTTGAGVREKMSLIVKLAPDEGFKKRLATDMLIFEKEMRMYSEMLPRISRKLGDPKGLSAQCLYCQNEPHTVIIMEDLSQSGFGMANRQQGFDLKHCLLVLEKLAKMHAGSLAVYKEDPDSMSFFNFGLFNNLHGKEMIDNFITNGFKGLARSAALMPGYEKYAEKLTALIPNVAVQGVKVTHMDEGGFNVLCHGDTWINNMLFQYAEDGITPLNLKFVDFQMSVFTSPAIDLHYFIFTSPSEEVRINHLDTLLEHYHTQLGNTIRSLGLDPDQVKMPSLIKLREDFEQRGFYGVVASAVIMPIIRAPPREDASLEGLIDGNAADGGFVDYMYNTPSYRESMQHLLPYFDERGLLD